MKQLVQAAGDHRTGMQPLNYSSEVDPVWVVTDGCAATKISEVSSRGADRKNEDVAAFYSAKSNSAWQNYPAHEIRLLAGPGIEMMPWHADSLQSVEFKWKMDHEGLTHLLN